MRVLLLAPQPFFQHRGTPIAVKALADVLSGQGHHVDILTYHVGEDVPIGSGSIHRISPIPGIRDVRPGFSMQKVVCDMAMFWRCFGLVRGGRYDVIHAVEEAVFFAMVVRRTFGIPYVYDMDSSLPVQLLQARPWLGPLRPLLEGMERMAVRGSIGVVAVCRSLEETARAYAPGASVVRLEDVSLLPPAPGDEDPPTTAEEPPTVMYVGNLEPYQGIDLLLESFRIAVRSTPARLVIVGGASSDVSRYAPRVAALGLSDRVEFLGARPISELGSHLRRATILVSPRTQGNNTPMKIYSYLDSGRPVLATRLPMHLEVLDDSIAVLKEPSPEAMSAGMISLLRDPELRSRLASAARIRVTREFSPASFRTKLLSFYEGLPLGPART